MKKLEWLPDLIYLVQKTVGVILIVIGGALVLNAAIKLHVFQFETGSYFNAPEQCDPLFYASNMVIKTGEKIEKKSPDEIQKCIDQKTQNEKIQYRRQKNENLIDGFVLLFIGVFLRFFSVRGRRK